VPGMEPGPLNLQPGTLTTEAVIFFFTLTFRLMLCNNASRFKNRDKALHSKRKTENKIRLLWVRKLQKDFKHQAPHEEDFIIRSLPEHYSGNEIHIHTLLSAVEYTATWPARGGITVSPL
jgi:hypothetical protein